MSAAANLLARKASQKAGQNAGQNARIADLPVMLAVLSVQQAAGFTATRMREGNPPEHAGDQPARMAVIFAPPQAQPSLPRGTSGAFNAPVAKRLSMGVDGEGSIYSGT
ncbi:MAG: hypothetical protein J7494_07805 [Sphingobium sp.]|nr:hypothetical protein [Sphingobium sp.]